MDDELADRVRALEAERQRPDVGEHVAGHPHHRTETTQNLQTLIGLLAALFRHHERP